MLYRQLKTYKSNIRLLSTTLHTYYAITIEQNNVYMAYEIQKYIPITFIGFFTREGILYQ